MQAVSNYFISNMDGSEFATVPLPHTGIFFFFFLIHYKFYFCQEKGSKQIQNYDNKQILNFSRRHK